MKISIDTKEDSPEEIQKLIHFLNSIIQMQSQGQQKNIFECSKGNNAKAQSQQGNIASMFSMFDSEQPKQGEESSGEDKKDDIPEIEIYK